MANHPYKHDTKLLKRLSKASGVSVNTIRAASIRLCTEVGAEFPSLTLEEWIRRYYS